MLAAYPAEYNLFGALFNVIKGIGSRVLGGLAGLGSGGIGSSLLSAAPLIAGSMLERSPAIRGGISDAITSNASSAVSTPTRSTLPEQVIRIVADRLDVARQRARNQN